MKKVVKFGGSSLASASQFKKVKAIIAADSARRFVVPSAPGKRCPTDEKVTDLLYRYYDLISAGKNGGALRLAIRRRYEDILAGLGLSFSLEEEFRKISEDFRRGCGRDYAASRGEYLNGLVMAEYLGIPFVDAAQVICFDRDGSFLPEETDRALKARLAGLERAVIPGFYGSMPDGTVKTFSRGGSDITGSLVARAVEADLYENWTDVSGFLLADPRIVDDPLPIGTITYGELRRLSTMGASVLHEDAVFPVKLAGIPINIRNTNRPGDAGTMIVSSTDRPLSCRITGIAGRKGFCAVNIRASGRELDRKVLAVLQEKNIPCESLSAGRGSLSVLVQEKDFRAQEQSVLSGIRRSVHPEAISLESDLALVAVGGRGRKAPGLLAGRVLSALEHANIGVKTAGRSRGEPAMLVGVRDEDLESAIRAIYHKFIQGEPMKNAAAFPV